ALLQHGAYVSLSPRAPHRGAHLMARGQKLQDAVAADETRPAGHEDGGHRALFYRASTGSCEPLRVATDRVGHTSTAMARILVADDEPGLREFITDSLELDDHTVVAAKDGREAAKLLDERGFDLVLTDLKMPGLDGMAILRKVRAEQPEVEVIMMTAHGTVDNAVEAMKLGAFEYLQKPLSGPDELRLLVGRALERRGLRDRVDVAERRTESSGPPLTYGDPAMRPVVDAIEKVARTSATVLLLGESGTGKEVCARAIHTQSPRAARPFMAINCAALSEQLLESELFGHEKGAFTGATERQRGRLELADGGTFFLDEVGELKPELQAKLLRVLQERRFE